MARRIWTGAALAAVVALTGCFPAPDTRIATIAGIGDWGYSGDGGPATEARFRFDDESIALDSDGDLYVVDEDRIRRVDAETGVISTFLHQYSVDGGPATTSLNAKAVVVDDEDDVYVADTIRVLRVDGDTGAVTVVAGNGGANWWEEDLYGGMAATEVPLRDINGIDLDGDGNLLIADEERYVLRVDADTQTITQIAGDLFGEDEEGIPARDFGFAGLRNVEAAPDGSLYVSNLSRVHRIDHATGIITTFAGTGQVGFSGDGGPATAARLSDAYGMEVDDAGNVYIADTDNGRVRVVAASTGVITTVAGDGGFAWEADDVAPTATAVPFPRALLLADDGRLLVTSAFRVRAITVGGAIGGVVHGAANQALAGTTVELYDADDLTTPIATDVTEANGWYGFSVRPGTYKVRFAGDANHQASWWSDAATGAAAAPITIGPGSLTGPSDQVLANANLDAA